MKNILFFLLPLFVDGVFGETESVSVKEGDSVTLHTDLSEIQRDDDIEWRYGDKGHLIAQFDRGENRSYTYDDDLDGKFRGRLQLDLQNGDLTIRNIRPTDSGLYEVTNKHSLNKKFNLIGLSAEEIHSLSVLVGDSVILHTDVSEIQKYDVIRWRFGPQISPLAEINKITGIFSVSDGADGRFRHRLQLDQTGSLVIKNTGINHSGLYEVDISSSKHTIHKTFNVTVSGEIKPVSVMKGESVTLNTGVSEIHTDDFMLWMFGDTIIAEIYKAAHRFYTFDGDDKRFQGRVELDHQTGSLTITNTRSSNSGLYDLKISSSRRTINKRIIVTVMDSLLSPAVVVGICVVILPLFASAVVAGVYFLCRFYKLKRLVTGKIQAVSVNKGSDVTLQTGYDDTRRHDVILWEFGNPGVVIAQSTEGMRENIRYDDGPDGRFRNRLKMDDQTGSLTITNIRSEHTGDYQLQLIRDGRRSSKMFNVTVSVYTTFRRKNSEEANDLINEDNLNGFSEDTL